MKRIALNLILALSMMLVPILAAVPVYAASCGNTPAEKQVFSGVNQTENNPGCDSSGVNNAISAAVNILSLVAGAAAIIAIIFGAFKYITSGGDSGKVANAKNTLIYAIVGIIIAVLAQLIVRFVITTANTVQCSPGQHLDSNNACVKN